MEQAAGLVERGTGKAWWVEQCVNHGPGSGTANPSTVPMRGSALRGGMGAPGPTGKGKPLEAWQLIRDRGVGQGLGRNGVALGAPLVGTVALPARWLSLPRGGRAGARHGGAQPGFGKLQPIRAHPAKPAGVCLLVPVPLPGAWSPSTHRAPACACHPLRASEPWFGQGCG